MLVFLSEPGELLLFVNPPFTFLVMVVDSDSGSLLMLLFGLNK